MIADRGDSSTVDGGHPTDPPHANKSGIHPMVMFPAVSQFRKCYSEINDVKVLLRGFFF